MKTNEVTTITIGIDHRMLTFDAEISTNKVVLRNGRDAGANHHRMTRRQMAIGNGIRRGINLRGTAIVAKSVWDNDIPEMAKG